MRKVPHLICWLAVLLTVVAAPAHAYIGPGAGITMLGALWGVIVAVALAIGAILFWPIRIMFRRRKRTTAATSASTSATTPKAS